MSHLKYKQKKYRKNTFDQKDQAQDRSRDLRTVNHTGYMIGFKNISYHCM